MSRVKNGTDLLLRVRQDKKSKVRNDKTRRLELGTTQTCCLEQDNTRRVE